MSAVIQNAPVHVPGMIGAAMQAFRHARPLIDQLRPCLENKQVRGAALVAIGAVGTKLKEIGEWVGLFSSSKKKNPILDKLRGVFPDLNTTNVTAVIEKIQELVDNITKLTSKQDSCYQVYNVIKKRTEILLQSAHINNDVKKSMVEAGLGVLPELNVNAITIAVSLADWVKEAGYCHKEKITASDKAEELEKEVDELRNQLSFCKEAKDDIKIQNLKLNNEKEICHIEKSTCVKNLKKSEDKLHDCENKGFIGRTFC